MLSNNIKFELESISTIFLRELKGYIFSSIAYIYATIFLIFANGLTFYWADLIAYGQANLIPFFSVHIYLYLIFLPVLAMRLWSEERKSGTIEVLLTSPLSILSLVIGKFLASWFFMGIVLILTMPMWVTINILGNPDNGVIFFSYLGSFMVSGVFLSICNYASIQTEKQIIAFSIGMILCLLLTITGLSVVMEPLSNILSPSLLDIIRNFSILIHYQGFIKGFFPLSALLYMISIIIYFIYLTKVRIDYYRDVGH